MKASRKPQSTGRPRTIGLVGRDRLKSALSSPRYHISRFSSSLSGETLHQQAQNGVICATKMLDSGLTSWMQTDGQP